MEFKVAALVTNDFYRDPRVHKTANTLAAAGCNVTVISITDKATGEARDGAITVVQLRNEYGDRINAALQKISSRLSRGRDPGTPGNDLLPAPQTCLLEGDPPQQWRYRIADCVEFAFLVYRNIRWALALRARSADIYYANDLDTLLCAFLLSRYHRSGIVYDSHELYIESIEGAKRTFKSLLGRLEGYLIRRCNAVITVNSSIAEELSNRYEIEAPTVAYNCPNRTGAVGAEEVTADRPVRIIYQGIYAADRALEEIVLSLNELHGCELHLRILFSDPSDEERLANLIRRENLSESVRIVPPVEMKDLVPALKGYDVGIIAYKPSCLNSYYATPNKLFEYMMGGLALASSDLPEIDRVVTLCANGVLFDPYNPHDIAMKLRELVSDRTRLREMKERSRYCSETVFTWENQEQVILDAVERAGSG